MSIICFFPKNIITKKIKDVYCLVSKQYACYKSLFPQIWGCVSN